MRPLAALLFAALIALPAASVAQEKPKAQDPFQNAYANPVDDPALPRVLIVGDSISEGYTPRVRRLLDGKANVHRPADNCRMSAYGVEHIGEWVGDSKWDVIHFNFGLWDWYGWKNPQATPESYANNLDAIVRSLKKTGARLIFGMTTPPSIGPERQTKIVITEARAKEFNDAATAVMEKHGVRINDLYALIGSNRAKYQRAENNVHYTEAGTDLLAAQVAKEIQAALPH
jgi:acyl-CoA thioesterase-1